MFCAVVIPVQAVSAVQLFADVFVGLGGGIMAVAHQPAEWIIVVHILYVVIGKTDGDAVVAQVLIFHVRFQLSVRFLFLSLDAPSRPPKYSWFLLLPNIYPPIM